MKKKKLLSLNLDNFRANPIAFQTVTEQFFKRLIFLKFKEKPLKLLLNFGDELHRLKKVRLWIEDYTSPDY